MTTDQRSERPRPWAVWGHERAISYLQTAIARDRVSHAYLIAGPAGVGKQAVAREFARAMCCDEPSRSPADGPCGACLPCRKVERGTHPDVQTFSLQTQLALAEKSGGRNTALTIETVRQIRSATALRPLEARRRVIIVEDAETLQEVAQEAFLKTVEEPAASVVVLLIADDAELLLPTIRSRCQAIDLGLVERSTIVAALQSGGVQGTKAEEIASLAAGRPGWALQAANDATLVTSRRETVDRALGWITGSEYDRLVAAVRMGDSYAKRRSEVFAELEILIGVWRDALLLRVALPDYLSFPWIAERLGNVLAPWDAGHLRRAITSVQDCLADLAANVRPRLALEAMVLAWPAVTR